MIKLLKGFKYLFVILINELNFVLFNNNLFNVCIKVNSIILIIMYVNNSDGLVKDIVWFDFRNNLVLIVFLIVINWMCLLFNFLCNFFVIIFFFRIK